MGYKKVNRNFFKKKIQKGLPKYQSKGQVDDQVASENILGSTGVVDGVGGLSQEDFMNDDTGVVDTPTDKVVDPDMYTTEGGTLSDEEKALLIQKQLDMMNFANMSKIATGNPSMGRVQDVVGNANLIEESPTQNDIIMAAIAADKKIKFDKHGNIKKIKKTGGIARGKFLRKGGSTGRKFL